jgi:transmembrane sensor
MSGDDLQWVQLARYLAGELTPAELQLFERWLAADRSHAQLLTDIRELWMCGEALPEPPSEVDANAALETVARHVGLPGWVAATVPSPSPSPSVVRTPQRPHHLTLGIPERRGMPAWARIAVGITVATAAGLGWHTVKAREARTEAARVALADRTYTTYATHAGQRAEITLSDGSRVVLGVASTLKVPQSFNVKRRVLKLEGEALFSVEHNAAKPFLVYSPHAVTEDIGTEFGVRAYPHEKATRVVVMSGEVVLRGGDSSAAGGTHLTQDQMARVDGSGHTTVKSNVDPDDYVAWASGRLVFRDAPIAEVALEVGRWYDLDVRVAGSQHVSSSLTASFGEEPVRDVLHAIEGALSVRAERHGRVVTLYPKS